MYVRKTTMNDLRQVEVIYNKARIFMRQSGNKTQWAHHWPPEKVIIADIESGDSYVCVDEKEQVLAVFIYKKGIDPTYLKIDGEWLNDNEYGVIHRFASARKIRGAASFCLDWALQQCPDLRIDTHEDNVPMRSLLTSRGFTYCGVIYLANGDPRVAYQKHI